MNKLLKDKRVMGIILVALVAVVIFDLRYFMQRNDRSHPEAQPVAVQQTPPGAVRVATHTAVPAAQRADKSDSFSTWNRRFPLYANARNPFETRSILSGRQSPDKFSNATAEKNATTTRRPHLDAIAVVNGKPVVLLDGEPVMEAGSLGNVRVLNIERDRVTLMRGQERWTEVLPALPDPSGPFSGPTP